MKLKIIYCNISLPRSFFISSYKKLQRKKKKKSVSQYVILCTTSTSVAINSEEEKNSLNSPEIKKEIHDFFQVLHSNQCLVLNQKHQISLIGRHAH
jgi:hypothetical protein